jgi:tripartite-type tricarboxylate transporter receptor subunit TctC
MKKATIALASFLLACSACVHAQEPWPTKAVRMVVPFAPGGATDIAARLVAQKLSENLGKQFYIENRGGANGSIGAEVAARALGDGYTIIMGTTGTHAINFSLYDKPTSDPVKDFAAVTRVAVFPNLILLHPSMAAKNVQELIALVKAQPGKFNYASTGSLLQLSAALFTSMAGIEMTNVPYTGFGPMMTAISNNDVQMTVVPVFSSAPLIKSGKVKAIAITSARRSPTAPEYPTVAESGLPGYESVSWYGVFATAGTPRPVVDRLNAEIRRIVAMPDIRDAMASQGAEPATDTPEEFAAIVKADVAKWARIVKATGAKPN